MRTAICAALAVLSTLLAVPVAHAAQSWGTAETVSRAPSPPVAAIGPDGRAVLAWTANNAAYGARRSSSRGFGEPFALYKQRSAVTDATVTFDADGSALFAFRRFVERNLRILSATLRPSGSRTSAISLSGPGSSAYDPTFAATAAGTLADLPTLAWWRRDGTPGAPPSRVQFARSTGGRLLASANDTLAGAGQASYAQALDGSVLAAATSNGAVIVARRAPGGSFSAPQTVSAGAGALYGADISIGPDGTAAVAWREFVGGTHRILVAVRAPGGAFGAPVRLSVASECALRPRVVVTSRGAVRVAYLAPGCRDGASSGRLRLVTPGGNGATLTSGTEAAGQFDMAADGRGGVTLAWQRREEGSAGGPVFARAVTLAGDPGSRRMLTAPGERARGIDLAVGARGEALVAWQTSDFRRLRAVHRPPSA